MFKTIEQKIAIAQARRSILMDDLNEYGARVNTKNRKERKLVIGVLTALYLELDQVNRTISRLNMRLYRRSYHRFVF